MNSCWTLNKLMASLSTCHLELPAFGGSLVKTCETIVENIDQMARGKLYL